MRFKCADFWEGILSLVEGREDVQAKEHLDQCVHCAGLYEQARLLLHAAKLPHAEAPREVIAEAKKLMQPAKQTFVAGLLRSSLAGAGARTICGDFQVVVGTPDLSARLMFTRTGDGWEVLGKAPSAEWQVVRGDDVVACELDGRFSFLTRTLRESGFVLTSGSVELIVPSAEELIQSEPGSSH